MGFPGSTSGEEPNARDVRDAGSIPGSGRSLGGGYGNLLQYSCLENPMDRGGWQAAVHRVSQSQTQLKQLSMHTCTFYRYLLSTSGIIYHFIHCFLIVWSVFSVSLLIFSVWMVYSLLQKSHSASLLVIFRKVALYVAAVLMCLWEETSSRSFYSVILIPLPIAPFWKIKPLPFAER